MKNSIWKIDNPVEYERNKLIKNALFFTAVFFFCIVVLLFGVMLCSLAENTTTLIIGLFSFAGLVTVGCGYVVINITEQQFYYIVDNGKVINT